jgi:hypothetical protein
VLAVAVLAACATRAPVPAGDGSADGTPAEVRRQAAAWAAARPAAYDYHYRVDCFCIGGGRWYRVSVRDGRVAAAALLDPDASGGKGPPLASGAVPTVDSLFAIVRRAYASGADSVAVEFDDTAHYPRRIRIDWRRGAVDDEVAYAVDSLAVRAGGRP